MYAIYDLKDKEQCVAIFNNIKEIAKYFDTTERTIRTAITRKYKREHRYLIVKLKEGD